MKRISRIFGLLAFLVLCSVTQVVAYQYEYWFDDTYTNVTRASFDGNTTSLEIDLADKQPGLHFLSMRVQESEGQWGGISRYMFYLQSPAEAQSATISGYEYWFDTDYSNRKTVYNSTAPTSLDVDVNTLSQGLHFLNFRVIGAAGQRGGLSRYMFYLDNSYSECSQVEYWIDENYADVQSVPVDANSLELSIDITGLTKGEHVLNVRGVTSDGKYATLKGIKFNAPGFPEPYAVLSEGNTVLTFYYDDKKTDNGGISVGPFSSSGQKGWGGYIKTVKFDESMANCETLTSTAYWFENCNNLTTIEHIEYLKTANVTDMYSMFYGCSALTSLDVSGFKTDNVTTMSGMFWGCSKLTSLDVTGFNTQNVTSMFAMFNACSGLTSLDVSGFDTQNVANMSAMFYRCSGLTSLDVTNFNTQNVTSMSQMFSDCPGLTSLDVSSFKTDKVTAMNKMFSYCSNLETIYVGDGWSTEKVMSAFSGEMFSHNTKLVGGQGTVYDANHNDVTYAHIDGGTANPGYFTDIKDMPQPYAVLSEENTVLTFYYDANKATTPNAMDVGPFIYPDDQAWYAQRESITTAIFDPSFANCTSLTSTAYWFNGCTNLTTIEHIEYLKTDNVTNMGVMFYGCSGLTSLDLSNFKTDNVTDISNMFYGCSGLTSLDLSCFKTDKVTNMNCLFYGCTGLTTIYVGSDWSTAAIGDGVELFKDCTNLKGGAGTTYDANRTNYTYAHIDGGTANPGYFTDKNTPQPYALLSEENTKLTFYYDANKSTTPNAMDVGPFDNTEAKGWYEYRNTITSVIFEPSFAECTTLTSTAFWFRDCKQLKTITGLEYLKTDNVTDMSYMFTYCTSLQSLDVTHFNTGKVTNMEAMFYECSALTELDVSHLNTSNVKNMYMMFQFCSGLTSLDVSKFNTGNVENMAQMFCRCPGLTSLDLSTFNTEKVTKMSAMFSECSALTSIKFGNFNTSAIADIYGLQNMFYGCSSLTTLDLSSFNTSTVDNMTQMFLNCGNLETIYVGDDWTTANVTSSEDMFKYCTKLKGGQGTVYDADHIDVAYAHIDGGTTNPGYLTDKNAALVGNAEPYAVLSEENTVLTFYYDDKKTDNGGMGVGPFVTNNTSWYDYRSKIKTVKFDESMENCESLTSTAYWFNGCNNLTTIENLNWLGTENVQTMANMFGSCSSLTALELGTFNTEQVTDMTGMFNGCSGLTTLNVSGLNTSSVKTMNNMFANCSGLTSLDVSGFNTENVEDMNSMFYNCYGLTTLKVNGLNTTKVEDMGNMFYGCSSLTSLDLSSFNTANVYYMSYMFFKCSSLTTLDLSSFNTANVEDMQNMFYGCSGLTTIFAGTHWSTASVTNSQMMFNNCVNLVGGQGTTYNGTHIDAAYAHIDGGATNPGYFTFKAPAGYEPYAVLEGNTLTFYYDDKKGDRGGMDVGPFANFSDRPWNGSHQGIVKVEFDESMKEYTGLTSTAHWLENFTSLTSVQGIENLKTDNVTDMSYMFYNCSNLEHLFISGLNASNVTDMQYMFGSCSNLKDIEIGNLFVTPNVTNMAGMFSYCEQLTSLDLSGFNTAKVTDMHDMFHNCMKLMTLNVQSFNTQEVTNMGSMFYNCSALTTLDVTSFNTAKVTDMSSMFNRCLTLTTLNVSSFDVGNVLDFGGMFVGCTGLTELDLSNFDTHSATRMAGMFAGCENLTKIYASEKWDNSHVTSGDDMFENCYNLKGGQGTGYAQDRRGVSYAHIDGGENNPGYFTDKNAPAVAEPYAVLDGNMLVFYYDTDKNAVGGMDIGPFATRFERGWNDDAGTITKVEFDESFAQYTGLTSTAYWFFDCNNLVAIDGLENLKTDEVTSMREMFMYCDKLTSLNLSSFNTTHVHDMSDMFYGCESLTILDLSSFYTLNVTDMSGMFFKNAMTVLDLSSFNTANVTNMMGMFRMCPYLTTIYVSDGWITDYVTNGNEMFMGCQNLKGGQGTEFTQAYMGVEYAHIDGGASNPGYLTDKNAPVVVDEIIAYGVLTDQMKKMTLYYDKNMASHTEGMTLPWGELLNGYEYNHARETLVTIDIDPSFANFNTLESSGYIFAGCMKLTAIHGLQYFVTDHMTKMQEMFASCESLTELDLSSFNTSHVTEMFAMFQGCSHLKTIIVGPGWTTAALTDEGHEMFAGCTSLVGEKGTTYSEPNFNADYAHIDGGPSNPGYLTGANEPDITEFEVDGIWYRVRQKGDHEVTVARVMYAEEERFVPSEVQYENIHWHVTALGEKAFADLHNVAVIGVPASIDEISVDLFNHCDHLAAIMWETNVPLTSAAMGEFNNPNLLLFMANKAGAPAGVTNIIDMSTFTADKIVLTDSEAGGNDFYCPETFMAKEISYTHVYDQATKIGACQGWESIVLPFDVQTFSHETKGEIYPIASLLDEQIEYDGDKPFWLYEFTQQDEFVEADKIMANRPYIISMPNDPAYWDDYILKGRITFSAKNVEISSSHHAWPIEGNNRYFVPNFKNDDYYNPDIFLLNVGDEYEGHKPGSVFSAERNNRKAHPFEAYFVMNGNPAKRYINIFDKDASSIREIPANSRTMKGAYDLMGRKMDSETTLPRGIYIIDGKKVMVK